MNLDDVTAFQQIDSQDMIGQINGLPDQLNRAYELGKTFPLPEKRKFHSVLISGMGGSAIGADLVASYLQDKISLPIIVHRDYELPLWAGEDTLVVASSHSGNTEETLWAYDQARQRGCAIVAICTGGKLAGLARKDGVPLWQFDHRHAPRTAVGFSFGLLLALFEQLGLISSVEQEVDEAVHAMRNVQTNLGIDVPVTHNPAKRMAGQLFGRWVVVLAADYLAPVARRWKGQINELAKAWAQFEFLPEADHNTLAGLENPSAMLMNMMALFIQAPGINSRNQKRIELTREMFMTQGINTDMIVARGEGKLAHIWTSLLFGDYMAYYLAMAYGIDPTPIPILDAFKSEMASV
ncbi:bifunctional phosphoglucose/phosphomannose isomerase [Anaerolinea thermophila]|uniref:Bifunctional phosphoglucose/phosphomannose isomerase n=1 Tax=Anaerolinea thermophila (strain DSM 14523 / JCM 11388 / NBRC 100420 / UNI-1) TaxID=926569 RepID=E8N4S9_ANATU|nr:bifunctional phosphoglucose/phosphomannose isomerase [Anaerolinea thermophila]BAJ63443.1 bifunctional phosphoglucose/phosphomannose isomerase [Anaerolinea thermophila UNI-1]